MPTSGVDLNNETTLDLWKTTLSSYDWENKDMEYLFPQHAFLVVDQIFTKDKKQMDAGTQLSREIIYREGGSVTWGNPGAVRTRSTMDVVTTISAPWATAWDQHSILAAELRRNRGRSKLKNLATTRRQGCMMNFATSLDSRMWGMPSTANNVYPYTIPYYLPPITGAQVTAGTGAGAHQGSNPSGFSTTMGLDASSDTYSRWRSYNGTWSNSGAEITEEDLLRMGRMFRRLQFKAPTLVDDLRSPKFSKFRCYADETIVDAYSAAMRRLNADIGIDPTRAYGAGMSASGDPTFKGHPIQWTEPLDTADATYRGANPLYFVNADYLFPVFEEGCYFAEDTPMRSVDQPDLFTTWVELGFQTMCENRQLLGGVLSYVAAS